MHPTTELQKVWRNRTEKRNRNRQNLQCVRRLTPLSVVDRSSKEKNQQGFNYKGGLWFFSSINIERHNYKPAESNWHLWTLHPTTARYISTFFSSAHGTFTKIDHMLGHKTILNKFKWIEII